jgi:hypothetical protein
MSTVLLPLALRLRFVAQRAVFGAQAAAGQAATEAPPGAGTG